MDIYIKMDLHTHTDVISSIVKLTGCSKYLELGIWDGININLISRVCSYCVGVDMTDSRRYYNYIFKKLSTDQFFNENTEMFDVIFIDADHKFESASKDFDNALKILNKHGIIFIHDTDPIEQKYVDFGYCGDSYKIIDWIKTTYPELDVLTLPITNAGLTIVKRNSDRRVSDFI